MAMYVWLCMYGYVCMAMYVWLCMYGYACMAMYVWLCMYGYVCRLCMFVYMLHIDLEKSVSNTLRKKPNEVDSGRGQSGNQFSKQEEWRYFLADRRTE